MLFRLRLALLAAVLFASAREVRAEPAIWVAHGPHADVYLFGTAPYLKQDCAWLPSQLAPVLSEISQLWLGMSEDNTPKDTIKLLNDLCFDPGHPFTVSSQQNEPPNFRDGSNHRGRLIIRIFSSQCVRGWQ